MNRIMRPSAVAVIGASAEDGKIGNSVMKNILEVSKHVFHSPIHGFSTLEIEFVTSENEPKCQSHEKKTKQTLLQKSRLISVNILKSSLHVSKFNIASKIHHDFGCYEGKYGFKICPIGILQLAASKK